MEIPWVVIGLARPQATARVATPGIFDFDHLGTEPGQDLGAGRPCLELGEIDHFDTGEKMQILNSFHSSLLPPAHDMLSQRACPIRGQAGQSHVYSDSRGTSGCCAHPAHSHARPPRGTASGHIIAKAHGGGARTKVRFDIHDSGLARRKGPFQGRADVGRVLDIFAVATKGVHELFIALIA